MVSKAAHWNEESNGRPEATRTTTLEIQSRVRASFERQGLMRHLGARLGQVGPGRVHLVLPNRPEVNQQHGYIHAGATGAIADSEGGYAAYSLFPENTAGAIADSEGGYAAYSLFPENTAVLTVEYKINLLAPAVGDHNRGRWNNPQIRTNPNRVPT
jgi:acyl-coenzyme A thioesterase PaaI-like protein